MHGLNIILNDPKQPKIGIHDTRKIALNLKVFFFAFHTTDPVESRGKEQRFLHLIKEETAQSVENYQGHFFRKIAKNMEKVQKMAGKRAARSAPLC